MLDDWLDWICLTTTRILQDILGVLHMQSSLISAYPLQKGLVVLLGREFGQLLIHVNQELYWIHGHSYQI